MARIRTIKPEFWTDEKILECSPIARLLFIGLWNFADDQGNIEGGHLSIKSKIFPSDDLNVIHELAELEKAKLLIPYKSNSESYYHIRGFDKHQKIDKKSKPRCPLYEASTVTRIVPTEVSSPEVVSSKGREVVKEVIKPLEHPEPDAPDRRYHFEEIWERYPEKKGKEKAWVKFKNQVLTGEDWDNINRALDNYIADMEQIRLNGHPDRAWQHGSTWFNESWKDYVNYTPPKKMTTGQAYDGIPPGEEPTDRMDHNDLINKIGEQMVFCEEHLADEEWEGAPPNLDWLNRTAGNLILEYSERFPKGPHIVKYAGWLDQQSEKVMNLEVGNEPKG